MSVAEVLKPRLSTCTCFTLGAFMLHMLWRAFCLSLSCSFALHVVWLAAAHCGGTGPAGVRQARRDLYPQMSAGSTIQEKNMTRGDEPVKLHKPKQIKGLATRMVALDNDTTGDLSNLSSSGIPETRAEEPTGATRLDMTRVERIYAGSACGHGSRLLRLDPVLPVQARRVRYLREPLKVATALAILYQCQEVVTSEPDGATGVQTKRPPETAMVAEAWNMTLTMGTRQEPEELQAGVRQVMDVQLDRSALGRLADEAGESEVSSFFQTTEPPLRTWAELMDVFWGWFEEGRQVGLAVRMVRRFMQDRDDEGYQLWSESAMGALEAGIPGSSGLAYDLSPPDFYLWATEVETVLYQAFQRDHSRRSEEGRRTRNSETDGEQVDLMERGRRGGERQRRSNRSRSARNASTGRRRAEPASGSGGPAGSHVTPGPNRTAEHLRTAPWRNPGPDLRTSSRRSGAAGPPVVAGGTCSSSSSSGSALGFRPNPPRDNDDCVDIWRHLLGVDSTALPAGLETTSQDGPFIPDVRASYIREVLSGFTAEQQALMTFGLLTAFRALMAELGVVLHAASYVEVVPESTAGDAGGDDADEEDDDGIPTLMLQVNMQLSADYEGTFLVDKQLFADDEGISLVQRDASEVAGILGRLQDALSGPDAGLSRLRAAHLRGRVQGLRLNSFVEAQISDQVEALCVVTESAGENEVARGFHALEDQVAEWSWSWWRMLEPLLLNQPDDPPNAQDTCVVNSSGNGSLHVVGPEPPLDEAQVAALAADQEVERRDAAALQHQQLFLSKKRTSTTAGWRRLWSRLWQPKQPGMLGPGMTGHSMTRCTQHLVAGNDFAWRSLLAVMMVPPESKEQCGYPWSLERAYRCSFGLSKCRWKCRGWRVSSSRVKSPRCRPVWDTKQIALKARNEMLLRRRRLLGLAKRGPPGLWGPEGSRGQQCARCRWSSMSFSRSMNNGSPASSRWKQFGLAMVVLLWTCSRRSISSWAVVEFPS